MKGYINAKLSNNKSCSIVTIFVLNARKCGNLLSKKACQKLGVIEMCETQAPTNISGVKYHTYTGVNQVNISERQRKEEVNISPSGKTNTPGSTETDTMAFAYTCCEASGQSPHGSGHVDCQLSNKQK